MPQFQLEHAYAANDGVTVCYRVLLNFVLCYKALLRRSCAELDMTWAVQFLSHMFGSLCCLKDKIRLYTESTSSFICTTLFTARLFLTSTCQQTADQLSTFKNVIGYRITFDINF